MDGNSFYETCKRIALYGHINKPIPSFKNVTRIFVCSTFRDMSNERNEIMNDISPRLEKYYAEKNYIFQIIDLQWGFFQSAEYDQLAEDIWLEELRAAKEISTGPFLVIILSHRYGSHVIPRKIEKTEFESILQSCNDEDRVILQNSYSLDENNTPQLFLFNSDTIGNNDKSIILNALTRRINQIILPNSALYKYTKSVTELEIIEGLINEQDKNRLLAFNRTIKSIETKPKLKNIFCDSPEDIEKQFGKPIEYAVNALAELKSKLKMKLDHHFEELEVDIPNKDDFYNTDSFIKYVPIFKQKFEWKLKYITDIFITENEMLNKMPSHLKEQLHHIQFCKDKLIGLIYRSEYMKSIISKIEEKNTRHIIIHGKSGSGKTSIVASVANEIQNIYDNEGTVLMIRFIGTSRKSYDLYNLLMSLIEQLSELYGEKVEKDEIRNLDKLQSYFRIFICKIANEHSNIKFFLILDSLDQLNYEYKDVTLFWLPDKIPSNLTIILSTITSTEYHYYELLSNRISDKKAFYHIGDLKQNEVANMFDERLKLANRKLQENQRNEILKAAETNTLPLYLKLLVDKACKCKSYENISADAIPKTLDSIITMVFDETENLYGEAIVKETLKYITLSRYGMYETYLQKLLSKNEKVIEFVDRSYQFSKISGKNYFPQIFLIRILRGLEQYLLGPMFRWYHRKFKEVATKRYCSDKNENEKCHRHIVSTFLDERHNQYNKFWLQELPYHAIMSNELENLKNYFFFDLKFLQIKIEKISIDELIDDFELAHKHYPNDQAIELLYQTLVLSSFKLRQNPSELAGQLLSRLYYEYPPLNNLIEKCFLTEQPFILSNRKFLAGPNPFLKSTSNIQKSEITYLLISNNKKYLISTSYEPTIKVFHTETMKEYKCFERKCYSTLYLVISDDDSVLYAYNRHNILKEKENYLIEAFKIESGENIFNFETSTISDSELTQHRKILFGSINELWYVSKNNWYILNWLTGEIMESFKTFDSKLAPCDNPIEAANYNGSLVVGMNYLTKVISLTRSGYYKLRNLDEEKQELRCMNVSENGVLVLSLIRYFTKGFEYNISKCNFFTLETLQEVRVNKAFNIEYTSPNADIIYGYAHNFVNVLDLKNRKVLFHFDHSSTVISACVVNEKKIICSTRDNKFHILDLSNSTIGVPYDDTFDIYCSRQIQFLRDEYDSTSPILFCYNIFDELDKEQFLLFDYKKDAIIKKIPLFNNIRNDLEPLCLCGERLFQFRLSTQSYLLTNLSDECLQSNESVPATTQVVQQKKKRQPDPIKKINHETPINKRKKLNKNPSAQSETPSDESVLFEKKSSVYRSFKRIDKDFVVFGIKSSSNEDNMCLMNINTFEIHVICKIERIIALSISQSSVAYISEVDNQNVHLLNYRINKFEVQEKIIENKQFSVNTTINLSQNGTFLAYKTNVVNDKLDLFVYNVENQTLTIKLEGLEKFEFISDNIINYRIRTDDSYLLIYVVDLTNCEKRIRLLEDDDKFHYGYYCFLKCENSPYLWFQRYSINRLDKSTSSISIYNTNDLETCVAELDNGCKLKCGPIALLDNENAVIVKEYNGVKFVKFILKV